MKRYALLIAALLASDISLAGAWGPRSFENDDALDFVQLCIASKSNAPIAAALQAAIKPGAIEAPDGAAAVVASELVAAAKGKPSELPKELGDWLKQQPKQEIAKFSALAIKALARVKDPDASELRQLWQESDDKQWMIAIRDLEKRLR
jgi:hypothetical protein